MPGGEGAPPEKIMIRRVGRRVGDTLEPVAPDANSPVILLGDSHNLVFHGGGDMHTTGAGLPDQLALEMGQPVELVAVRGSGATPARVNLYRRAVRNPEYWRNRRWVVWCFAAREFTESDGWRKIPVQPPGKD
jgi:alginate O-acetyltransferase complex protein AlgJ